MAFLTDPLGWFTLRFPDAWEQRTEDCVTILTSPHGMMFVSGGRHAGGRQPSFGGADFLARFLRSLGMKVEESEIGGAPGEGCRIYEYAHESEGHLWRYFSVTDDETALLISYMCEAKDAGKEKDAVDRLIGSVRLYHSAPGN